MTGNLILLCVGLIICFGGMRIKRIVSALMGLIWGALFGLFIGIVALGGVSSLFWMSSKDEKKMIAFAVVFAVLFAFLSVLFERLCAAINTFMSASLITLLLFASISDDLTDLTDLIFIALLIGLMVSIFAYIYYHYAFILVTAFSGGFIAATGAMGLYWHTSSVTLLFMSGEGDGAIIIIGILLGICGTIVQRHRFKAQTRKDKKAQSADTDDTVTAATAGRMNTVEPACSTASKAGISVQEENKPMPVYCSECGNLADPEDIYCPNCGHKL